MLVTSHVLQGALIGRATSNPAKAFGIGFMSHLAADSLPHWGITEALGSPQFMAVAVPDGLAGLAAIGMIGRTAPAPRRLSVLAGMCGAALPDIDKPAVLFFGKDPFPAAFTRLHIRIQRENPKRLPQDIALIAGLAAAYAAVHVVARRRAHQPTVEPELEPTPALALPTAT